MNEIKLDKSFKFKESADNTELETKLYKELHSELSDFFNDRFGPDVLVQFEKIKKIHPNVYNQLDLKSIVQGFIMSYRNDCSSFFVIQCRNFLSLPLNLENIHVQLDSENKIEFYIIFRTNSLFLNYSFGESVVVSNVGLPNELFQVDINDKSLSLSYLSNPFK